mgnify:CR=1 FL=1|jgi:NAD(P) transhydrogenase subunit beta
MARILSDAIITEELYYVICAILSFLVLFGIYLMSKVEKAPLGNALSATALGLGIILTLVHKEILTVWVLYPALALGACIGLILALRVRMIEIPQLVGLLNGVGGGASALVGLFAYLEAGDYFSKATALLAVAVGMVTLLGSLVAAGKLHKLLPQKPLVLPMHTLLTGFFLILTLLAIILGTVNPWNLGHVFLVASFVFASVFGTIFTLRVGGADMPITISLLNSLSGVAAAISGLAVADVLLVSVGAIVGASGLLLTQIMCRAMNRKLLDILLGKTTVFQTEEREIKEKKSQKDPLKLVKSAKNVIIVPGYGMAVAQAQHLVKSLADKLKARGAQVRFAIHPVAGRMPGHMNVLLAEADVDYEDLYEMEAINSDFKNADLTIVVGANDVLNPAARNMEGTPIYGMPILNVDECPEVLIFNYDLRPGYSGVPNPLYEKENVTLVLGDAAETLPEILAGFESE